MDGTARRAPVHVRLAAWFQQHPVAGNAIVVTALLPLPLLITTGLGTHLGLGILLLPLYLRPVRPGLAAGLFAALVVLALIARGWPVAIGAWAAPWLIYTVAARCPPRRRYSLLITALALGLLGSALWPWWWLVPNPAVAYSPGPAEWLFGAVVLSLLTVLVIITSYLAGDLRRATLDRRTAERERAEALEERALRLEVEREQEIRLAAQDERARIAREMHDVVAHSLSVVIAQADGARYAAAADPTAAPEALSTIAATARGSLSEMRRLLGVLRTEEETERAPVPTLQDLPELVASMHRTGLEVELQAPGSGLPVLAPGPSLALYRLVQEGLTNTLKHSPGATRAVIRLRHDDDDDLILRVISDGLDRAAAAQARAGASGGQGLRGLRERFALYGGEIDAGPDPADPRRWVLTGWLPFTTQEIPR